jgi:hypothetical protein
MASRFLDEGEAVRVVLEAIEDALERLRGTHAQMLLRRAGGVLSSRDLAWLRDTERTLLDLADALADRSVFKGDYGRLLEEAMRKGAAFGAGVDASLIHVAPDAIKTALWPARLQIKDLMSDGARSITELTARAMTAGWSQRELADRIQDEVVLHDAGGTAYGVPQWRAELQARNEPMKVYREASAGGWTDDTLLEMVGPDDAKTAGDVCSDYLGEVMALVEWRAAGADPQGYGWHPN